MYAIVEMLGQQFKVEMGQKVFIHRMNETERDSNYLSSSSQDHIIMKHYIKNLAELSWKNSWITKQIIQHTLTILYYQKSQ